MQKHTEAYTHTHTQRFTHPLIQTVITASRFVFCSVTVVVRSVTVVVHHGNSELELNANEMVD